MIYKLHHQEYPTEDWIFRKGVTMKESANIFINLLSAAISEKSPDSITSIPDWDSVYEEAKAHQVHTLLFPLLEEIPVHLRPESVLFESWKYETLREATLQLLHMDQMEKVFLLLHKEGIPVIALKGLILRGYYPAPELRTMLDADILIHREDFKKVHSILVSLGYKKGKTSERHTAYSLNGCPDIELHEILTDSTEMENLNHFTFQAWENASPALIGSAPVLTLSVKDQLIYLMFHIIHHVLLSGVGLRQLCDLTVFAVSHWEEILWEDILYEMEPYSYDKFTLVLLSICQDLFGLPLSESVITEDEDEFNSYKKLLIEDIINSGVYGKRTKEREASRHILLHIKGKPGASARPVTVDKPGTSVKSETVVAPEAAIKSKTVVTSKAFVKSEAVVKLEFPAKPLSLRFSGLCNLLRFFFPAPGKLGYQYRYARNHPILLPLAWVHRAFYNIKRLSLLSFVYNRKAAKAYEERIALLTWLKLR